MTIEELIRKRFLESEEIAGKLATYAGSPAVFLQNAPADVQTGWDNGTQYPRIVNYVELRADNERKSQGLLRVDLYCDIENDVPEDIEPLIRASLKDIVMQPESGSPYCFAWQRTDGFELETKNADKRIAGYEIVFDMVEYPVQITTEPDPVEAVNEFLKTYFPDAFVLWSDEVVDMKIATAKHPIVYVRVDSCETDYQSYAVTWIKCRLVIHVIAPEPHGRNQWVRAITNQLMLKGEVVMKNLTPMLITNTKASSAFDYLVTGQITMEARYGLVRLTTESDNRLTSIQIRR